jgi:hypothetical protein
MAACRVDRRPPDPDEFRGLDWPYVGEAADRQGVAPLLADWMAGLANSAGPEAAALRDAYWVNHFRNQVILAEQARVERAADAAGIETMPMKGASLATDYYQTPALRVMSDLDVLVRPQDLARLAAVMTGLNYYAIDTARSYVDERWLDDSSREHSWIAMRDGLQMLVEIRTASIEPAVGRLTDLDRPFTLLLHRYTAEVWDRAAAFRKEGKPLRVPPEDLLLTVATHLAAKHVDFRLIWLHDIARIVTVASSLDWDYLARTADRLRVTVPVTAALYAATRWLGAPITDAQLAKVAGPLRARGARWLERWDDRQLRRLVATLGSRDLRVGGPGLWPLVSALNRVRGVGAQLRVLRWVGLPSRAYLEHRGINAASGVLGHSAATLRRVIGRFATFRRAGPSRANPSTQP